MISYSFCDGKFASKKKTDNDESRDGADLKMIIIFDYEDSGHGFQAAMDDIFTSSIN